jgi:hypothetical protein
LQVFGNHVVELVLPFLTLLPFFRWAGLINGTLQLVFQLVLISTGNLSFLNWLTMLPALWFFDDHSWKGLFSQKRLAELYQVRRVKPRKITRVIRQSASLALACVLAYLSLPIVMNLLSTRQIMNTSFEPFRIVNTYGAFGSVTKTRTEVVFEGTTDEDPAHATWREYEFKCKPGRPNRAPCLISPYHYRLDWLMWFAAFQNYQSNPWLVHLAGKMLDNDPIVDSLLAVNPFSGSKAPKFVRASHYRYKFAPMDSKAAAQGSWWTRKKVGEYLPAVNKAMLKSIYDQFGWRN